MVPAGRGARVGGEAPGERSALSQARRVEPVLRLLRAVCLSGIPSSLRASSWRLVLLQAVSACSVPDSYCPLRSLLPSASPCALRRDRYRHCHVKKNLKIRAPLPSLRALQPSLGHQVSPIY